MRTRRWVLVAAVVAGMAMCGATAFRQRLQAQSPAVAEAVRITGARLLLANHRGGTGRIFVMGPSTPAGIVPALASNRCGEFEFAWNATWSKTTIGGGATGKCVAVFLDFVEAPSFVADMWSWVRMYIEGSQVRRPGTGSPTPRP